jgi:hypothetical protein
MSLTFQIELRYCLRVEDFQVRFRTHASGLDFLFPKAPYFIGFLSYLFPYLILSRLIQRGGQQQSNLFPVSAGSDLRMSPLRPNPYLSIGIGERRSKKRGFLRLFSQAN